MKKEEKNKIIENCKLLDNHWEILEELKKKQTTTRSRSIFDQFQTKKENKNFD